MLTAAAIQFNVKTADIDFNLAQAEAALGRVAAKGAKLAVLPELWSTGFAYRDLPELAKRTDETVARLCELSANYNMVIIGSQAEAADDGRCYNTIHVVDCGRVVAIYRKLHLFSLLGEDRSFKGGDSWCLAETSLGKIGVIVCYDLRFPELTRRLAVEGAELVCVPAQWPKPRQEHWRTLLRARAIENQLPVVAANCCGMVGKLDFFGMSMVIDHCGEVLADAGEEPGEIIAVLDPQVMTAWRSQIPCFNDRKPHCY